ncbi:MAG: hypothetical protein GY807_18465, partial [Gammaproteobacteria bacterium]|nr:hypothetical protein [Gammaproteobacteria bacterium]
MWFGQHLYFKIDGSIIHGRWIPYPTRADAIEAGCDLVSVLELACSVATYRRWITTLETLHKDPRSCHPCFPFLGPFYADFDHPDVEALRVELRNVLSHLMAHFQLDASDFRLWFTGGKGFHFFMNPAVFGAAEFQHRHLPRLYKDMAIRLGFGSLMDPCVYSEGRGRLWRVENRLRPNGYRKIPISFSQLTRLTAADLFELAKNAAVAFHMPKPNPSLARLWQQVRQAGRKGVHISGTKQNASPTVPLNLHRNRTQIPALLDSLPSTMADGYAEWLKVGMALHHGFKGGQEGLLLWGRWSQQSAKFDRAVLQKKWESFSQVEGGVTIATLFYKDTKN